MSDAEDAIIALKWVQDLVQWDTEPVMSQGELELKIAQAQIATVWQPSTFYHVGRLEIVPELRNGHAYQVLRPGTSQTAARAFNDWPHGDYVSGIVFGDGSSDPQLLLKECGTDRFNPTVIGAESNVYDIGAAAKACWLIKARRCTPLINNGDIAFESIRRHCLEEAGRFHPFYRPVRMVRA